PLVFPLVLRVVGERADAADVLQDVFWEAWRTAAAYDPARGTPEAWIVMRARTRAIDRVRAVRRRSETFVPAPDAASAPAALDGDELTQFEAHLPTCPACEAAVRDAEETLARAVLTAPPQAPPAAAREALVRRVTERRDVRSRAWLRWAAATLVAAGAAAVFAGTWVAVRYEARLGQMAREMAAAKEALREELSLDRRAVELLRDPTTRVVDLRGRDGAAAASGRMIWNAAGGGHLLATGLPPAPPGKTYALWAIARGTPRPV